MLERIRRCPYCKREQTRSAMACMENPYCRECLHERMEEHAKKVGPTEIQIRGHYAVFVPISQIKEQTMTRRRQVNNTLKIQITDNDKLNDAVMLVNTLTTARIAHLLSEQSVWEFDVTVGGLVEQYIEDTGKQIQPAKVVGSLTDLQTLDIIDFTVVAPTPTKRYAKNILEEDKTEAEQLQKRLYELEQKAEKENAETFPARLNRIVQEAKEIDGEVQHTKESEPEAAEEVEEGE